MHQGLGGQRIGVAKAGFYARNNSTEMGLEGFRNTLPQRYPRLLSSSPVDCSALFWPGTDARRPKITVFYADAFKKNASL